MAETHLNLHQPAKAPRRDVFALWGGIVFSLAFSGLIWWAGGRLDRIPLLPDQGAAWYYWKLPNPTFWSQATAWGGYLLHQFGFWALILYAQRKGLRYTGGLHRVNLAALALNAGFIGLHFIQTHIWYDGIAQDVSVFSSQASVVVLLIWVLLMENSRRGLFFGTKAPISKQIIQFARKYHGYYFAWATVYTFWFHPMVATSGHIIGFFYMFLLLLQGSLFFTRIHLNRWWNVSLEVLVAVHGALVAVMNANNLWPMFFFGFSGIFVITQMHGLGLARPLRIGIFSLYAAAALWVYSGRGLANIHQITWIPVIEYLGVFILAGLFGGGLWLARRFGGGRREAAVSST